MSDKPPTALPTVRLKIERRSSHPWIFQKMVEKPHTRLLGGTIVDIEDRGGQWVARGFYNGHSRISVRVLTSNRDEQIDADFFRKKIRAAVALRKDMLQLDRVTNAYRLVHSEADDLSGLVVDKFGSTIVVEFFAAGMFRVRQIIIDTLAAEFPDSKFYWFAEEHVGKQESFDCRSPEPPPPEVIHEHGLKFRVAPGTKHKTGFFLDQRDNRKFLSEFCGGKRVLDICCNTGGFAVYAKAAGGASESIGLDLDEQVIELAKQNAKLNGVSVRFIQSDLFPWLRDAIPNGERFDVVVLDPAKLTRDREDVEGALRKYTDMNRLAMQVVSPGGVFLSCSCTGLVSEPDFLEMLRRAAWQAGRHLQIFRVSGAGADHPFLAHVQEGRYLKAVFARVS
ncbi:class I SAM-dependent rRNA methyltransferase [Limnoglobus roseus]|uniref:Class I SAM-dependent rRNA methyltransferase n=1 Tax=Limnoglobus roseus TaxID=2598579 RepID=A0A5C1AII9_9BACT|nr:class I SAM-dependent rRNA methyltransferase [Limnoglobus roseus]QEL18073.1 class I SAM-dependent rRNA methyltransferase [Limnoglobus roseus]